MAPKAEGGKKAGGKAAAKKAGSGEGKKRRKSRKESYAIYVGNYYFDIFRHYLGIYRKWFCSH